MASTPGPVRQQRRDRGRVAPALRHPPAGPRPGLHTGAVTVRRRYTATAERTSLGWWSVQCDQAPGALSQVEDLDDAVEFITEAIAYVEQIPEADVTVAVHVADLPPAEPAE